MCGENKRERKKICERKEEREHAREKHESEEDKIS